MFGIDIETGGLSLDDELRLVQISNGEDTFVIDVRESDPRPLLQEFTGDELIAHNANFEESRLKRHTLASSSPSRCTTRWLCRRCSTPGPRRPKARATRSTRSPCGSWASS